MLHSVNMKQLLPLLKTEGTINCKIGELFISLNLKNPHEKMYAANIIADIRVPQHDIDVFLSALIIEENDIVVDGGANIGVTAAEFIKSGAAKVICYEPHPELFKRLTKIESEKITYFELALARTTETRTLFKSELHNQGSAIVDSTVKMFPRIFATPPQTVEVQAVSLDEHLREQTVNILKLDIEGAELETLEGASQLLARSELRAVILECYENITEIFETLKIHFPHAYRTYIIKDSYKPILVSWDVAPNDNYENTSPTYLFSKTPMSFDRSSLTHQDQG